MIADSQLNFQALYMVPTLTSVGTKRGWAQSQCWFVAAPETFHGIIIIFPSLLPQIASMSDFAIFFKLHRQSIFGLGVVDIIVKEPYLSQILPKANPIIFFKSGMN